MNDLFLLYLLTRLNELKCVLTIVSLVAGVLFGLVALLYGATAAAGDDESSNTFKKFLWLWKPLTISLLLNTLLPTQQDVMFIAGGSAVLEAAKSDTAQRVASKSVQVVEKYLDGILREDKK